MKGRYSSQWGNRRRSRKAQERYGGRDLAGMSDAEVRRRSADHAEELRGRGFEPLKDVVARLIENAEARRK